MDGKHGYAHELERVRLRAMLAAERVSAAPSTDVIGRLAAELSSLEASLFATRQHSRGSQLATRLGLDRDDLDLLWTAVAFTADPGIMPHALVLGGGDAKRGLTLATHALVTGLQGERARSLAQRMIGPHPLLRNHVLEWSGDGLSAIARPLVAPIRTIDWLAGGDDIDPALLGAGCIVETQGELALDTRQRASVAGLPALLRGSPAPLIVVEGPTGTGRRTAIAAAARESDHRVVALDLRRLPHGLAALESALVGLRRECCLRDAIPVVLDLQELADAAAFRVLARGLDVLSRPVVVTTNQPVVELSVARPLVHVRWTTPDVVTRRTLWDAMLGADDASRITSLDDLAIRYGLGAGGISRAIRSARLVAGSEPLQPLHLIEGVRTNIAERLGELAQRQEVRQRWDELVLAPDILDQVKMLVSRVRHAHRVLEDWGMSSKLPKGSGVAALFSGPPGTGKTMVAGLIARELDLELYQVDLSKVVSKWVGETEKQLAKIFEAAEAGHALLLFDEADALFAKRTEVKSSNDRYANLEVNYLLQRIESFGGVSILTTNLDASIDPALRRRLAATVTFWPPDDDERQRLWRSMLTARAPVADDIDVEDLAMRYDKMTGANIRNAVLAAAFLAAAENTSITQGCLDRASRGEYASMGRVIGRT